jgi:hypothetical protein
LTVTGPSAVPTGDAFELTLEWNEPAFRTGSTWFGVVDVGTDAANPDNVKKMVVQLSNTALFSDGFETGDTSVWSSSVP